MYFAKPLVIYACKVDYCRHVPTCFTALSSSRRLSFEEDSFTKFTIDMMKQYMQEEEIRAQHQVGGGGS